MFKISAFFIFIATFCFNSNTAYAYIQKNQTPIIKYLKNLEVHEFSTGLPTVDCIYVINLDARPEKWARLKPLFDKKRLKANRVSAVNGWEISDKIQKQLAGPYTVNLRGGQTGCLLSHVSILNDAYKRDLNRIWVLEDDLKFVRDVQMIPDLIKELESFDPEWDIFYTNTNNRKFPKLRPRPDQQIKAPMFYKQKVSLSQNIDLIRRRQGTQSMVISRNGIKKILNYFTHTYLWTAIDNDIHMIPDIREYAPKRDIVTRLCGSPSDTKRSSSLNAK